MKKLPKKQRQVLVSFGDKHLKGKGNQGKKQNQNQSNKNQPNKNPLTKQQQQALQDKWRRIMVEAHTYSKMKGDTSASIERLVEKYNKKLVSWREILYKEITNEVMSDYTYSRPSKRSITTGFYMPSVRKENIEVAVAIDTSGSISQKQLSTFLGEVINISKSFNNIRIYVIFCDAEVSDCLLCENGNIKKILEHKIKGGGGTDFRPVYKYLKNKLPDTKLLVYFTDGYGDYPKTEEVKTLWILTEPYKVPFGDKIEIKEGEI